VFSFSEIADETRKQALTMSRDRHEWHLYRELLAILSQSDELNRLPGRGLLNGFEIASKTHARHLPASACWTGAVGAPGV